MHPAEAAYNDFRAIFELLCFGAAGLDVLTGVKAEFPRVKVVLIKELHKVIEYHACQDGCWSVDLSRMGRGPSAPNCYACRVRASITAVRGYRKCDCQEFNARWTMRR